MDSAAAFGKSIENWKIGQSILRLQLFDFYDAVAAVQELLFNLEYLDVTDGYYLEATRDAVKLFQAKHGLPADGIVGPATYDMLVSPAAKKKSDGAAGPVKLLYGKSEGPQVIDLLRAEGFGRHDVGHGFSQAPVAHFDIGIQRGKYRRLAPVFDRKV